MKRDLTDEQLNQTVNLSLPLHAVLRLADIDTRAPGTGPLVGRYDILPDCLPAIGEAFEGGIYAGLTLRHNAPMALVLLPGDEELSWSKASEWAKAQGGELPSRADALMLWQNVPKQFQDKYYWTSEEYTGNADGAWFADFATATRTGPARATSTGAVPSAESPFNDLAIQPFHGAALRD